jgi:succinate dehydrogenase / fumarate reductase iron-sulfur subunit
MKLTLEIWRQKNQAEPGQMKAYTLDGVSPHMSFLEMLDFLNERLLASGEDDPVAFDYDCREGICGACSLVINGTPHGPETQTTTCQLHMRSFRDGDRIRVEPFRAQAFPIIKDLTCDRRAMDRLIQRGGYVSVSTGNPRDANGILIPKPVADEAFDGAACIGCGACVAACKNASAMLFVSAKVSQLALLPQGQVERKERVRAMARGMDEEGFGGCTNTLECEAVCPKGISTDHISRFQREYLRALVSN